MKKRPEGRPSQKDCRSAFGGADGDSLPNSPRQGKAGHMQNSHIRDWTQANEPQSGNAHRSRVAKVFAHGQSPRVEELVGYTDAARLTGLSTHQLQYATAKGELIAVPLPNGKTALLEAQLKAWLKARERGT